MLHWALDLALDLQTLGCEVGAGRASLTRVISWISLSITVRIVESLVSGGRREIGIETGFPYFRFVCNSKIHYSNTRYRGVAQK